MKLIKLITAVSVAPFKKMMKPLNSAADIPRSVVMRVNTENPKLAMTEEIPSIKAKTSAVLYSGMIESDK